VHLTATSVRVRQLEAKRIFAFFAAYFLNGLVHAAYTTTVQGNPTFHHGAGLVSKVEQGTA
jgi:hypothetical protein